MPILYEPLNVKGLQVEVSPRGWERTTLLAFGGATGVLLTALCIHLAKQGKAERGVSGWLRTLLLAGGAFGGTMATAAIIHFLKQTQLPLVEEI